MGVAHGRTRRCARRLTAGSKKKGFRRADEILDRFNPTDRMICRHIMLQLVQHLEGEKYVRRRLPLSELVSTRFDETSRRVPRPAGTSRLTGDAETLTA